MCTQQKEHDSTEWGSKVQWPKKEQYQKNKAVRINGSFNKKAKKVKIKKLINQSFNSFN
jgi:hypothetical protein